MLLRNLQTVQENKTIHIRIADARIVTIESMLHASDDEVIINFDDAIVFPGLINSHDHLDFNLFPKTGNRLYQSYVEWGKDIHQTHKDTIDAVLKIPLSLRIQWGIYKNLLAGVTTVVNHGPQIDVTNDLITVFQETDVLHSVKFEKRWRLKLNGHFARKVPVSIHVGEGINADSTYEIDQLSRWNLWRRDIVGIHGIAMSESQAEAFKALVWCPDSNYFLIGNTARIDQLKKRTTILFGTDSTLSADWNIWHHLRIARNEKLVSDRELYDMTGKTAANLWSIKSKGNLDAESDADIVVARKNGRKGYEAYFSTNPEDILLVIHKGKIRLLDEQLLAQLQNCLNLKGEFSRVEIGNNVKYVYGDIPQLITKIRGHYDGVSFPINVQ